MLNDRLLECHRRYLCLSWYVQGTAHAPGWCRNLFTMKTQPGISSPIGPLLWGQSSSISGGDRPWISSFQWEPHTDVFAFYCSSSLQTNKTIQSAFFVLIAKIIIVIKSELREAFFSLFFSPLFFLFFLKFLPDFVPSFRPSMNEYDDAAEAGKNLAITQAITPTSPQVCRDSVASFVCLGGSHHYLISFLRRSWLCWEACSIYTNSISVL